MPSWLARLTMAQVPTLAPAQPAYDLSAKAYIVKPEATAPEAPAPTTSVPIFSNPKALTFPGIVVLVKAAWEVLKRIPMPWFGTVWFPLAACIALGVVITASDIQTQKTTGFQLVGAIIVGLLNSIVTFGAVIGIGGP